MPEQAAPRDARRRLEQKRPLGRIVSVSGSQAVVMLHASSKEAGGDQPPPEIGTLLKVETPNAIVLALVSALTVPVPSQDPAEEEMKIIELEFVGELPIDQTGILQSFQRGVSRYPSLGHEVFHVSNHVLSMAYACDEDKGVRIGTIVQAPSIAAMVKTDDLLGKHFAILGATGSGKSCSVALLLRNLLAKTPNAHIVLLDPHQEYSSTFGDKAEVINSDNLHLPFWLLTFEEIVEILIGNQPGRETDIESLRELIPMAKARYGMNQRRGELRSPLSKDDEDAVAPSVDTPVPYRMSDLVSLLDGWIGKLEMRGELAPFKRLKARIETISRDPRYAFMFGSLTVQDTMASVLSRLFRIPVGGKPITIVELTGLPSEIVNVVVAVLSRMTFDFALWSNGQVPITLICEEAHRYMPANDQLGFEPTKRALSKIAKEGRKYGVSLTIVSQRPGELDPTILSQCATMFCMRLANERDQEIVRARVSDSSASLLDVLPSLGTREAVAFGEGVALPTRIRFDLLPQEAMPRNATASFSQNWQHDVNDASFVSSVVARWRAQSRSGEVAPHQKTLPGVAYEKLSAVEPAAGFDHAPLPSTEMQEDDQPTPPETPTGKSDNLAKAMSNPMKPPAPINEPQVDRLPARSPVQKRQPAFGAAAPRADTGGSESVQEPASTARSEPSSIRTAHAPLAPAQRTQANTTKSAVEMARASLANQKQPASPRTRIQFSSNRTDADHQRNKPTRIPD